MPTYIQKFCEQCSMEFAVVPRYKKKRFCNVVCYQAHKKLHSTVKLQSCLQCNNPLTKKHSYKFCSQSCAALYNNNNRSDEDRSKQRQTLRLTLAKAGRLKTDAKEIYKDECTFKFRPYQHTNLPGYDLLLEHGIYHYKNNPGGVVRDHIVSREYGWQNNIPASIISHPANCQFISNQDNIVKNSRCGMTHEDLLNRIAK
jgi:hypothetical protein